MIIVKKLVEAVHENAKEKGFWDTPREFGTLMALIHSEVSEALEADRNGEDNIGEELADIVIRVADVAGHYNIDLEEEITKKMTYNIAREHKHGKAY